MYKTLSTRNPMLSIFDNPFFQEFFAEPGKLSMPVDVQRQENGYLVKADLPGVPREDIHLEVNEGVLTITAEMNAAKKEEKDGYILSERRSGRCERSFRLEDIDEASITADYSNGVLTVSLPRLNPEDKPTTRIISIN